MCVAFSFRLYTIILSRNTVSQGVWIVFLSVAVHVFVCVSVF